MVMSRGLFEAVYAALPEGATVILVDGVHHRISRWARPANNQRRIYVTLQQGHKAVGYFEPDGKFTDTDALTSPSTAYVQRITTALAKAWTTEGKRG